MCSLARFYYSGNPERKSTAITAKLLVFLNDIFSKIHKSFAFDDVSGSKASVCPASARLCRRHVRQGSASQSQYIYLQAKHSVLADGCALRVSGTGSRAAAAPLSDTGRRPAAPAAWLAGSPRTAADPGRGICTCRQCIMSCFPPQKSLPFSVAGFGPNSGKFSISRRFANVKCEKHPNFSVSFRLFVFKWRNILARDRPRLWKAEKVHLPA